MSNNQLDKGCFRFKQTGSGRYEVRYRTPMRGDYWLATITDMTMIDAVHNVPTPLRRNMVQLRRYVKQHGQHFTTWT